MVVDGPMGWVEVELDHGSGWAQNIKWMTNTDCIIQNGRNGMESTEQKARKSTEQKVQDKKYGTKSMEQKVWNRRYGMRSMERKVWNG